LFERSSAAHDVRIVTRPPIQQMPRFVLSPTTNHPNRQYRYVDRVNVKSVAAAGSSIPFALIEFPIAVRAAGTRTSFVYSQYTVTVHDAAPLPRISPCERHRFTPSVPRHAVIGRNNPADDTPATIPNGSSTVVTSQLDISDLLLASAPRLDLQ
jgi:hypothetical protein